MESGNEYVNYAGQRWFIRADVHLIYVKEPILFVGNALQKKVRNIRINPILKPKSIGRR